MAKRAPRGKRATRARPAPGLSPIAAGVATAANLARLRAFVADLGRFGLEQSTLDKYAGAHKSYLAYCLNMGFDAEPLNRDVVAGWLHDKSDYNDNATSVGQWLAQLYGHRRYAEGAPPFGASEGEFFAPVIKGLHALFGQTTLTASAITAELLMRVWTVLRPDPSRDLAQWAFWVHLLAAYHWLLRPNEHAGETAGILVRDVSITTLAGTGRAVARVDLYGTKGLLRVGGVCETTRTAEMPGSPLDLVSTLRRYVAVYNLTAHPDQLLFPDLGPTGGLLAQPMTMDGFNARLRSFFAAADITQTYSSRGLRSGRRSDLRNAGTPVDIVCQLGRWKSESASQRYMRADDNIVNEIKGYAFLVAEHGSGGRIT
jgi:hypothetical protein